MSKSDVLAALNHKKNQLADRRKELRNLEEKYTALEEFSSQCTSRIGAFDDSMARRKRKLLSFDSILGSVRSAAKYRQRMSDMLNGADYSTTVSYIDQLQNSIATEKRNTCNSIQNVEGQISSLEARVSSLQYEYNNYPEEDEEDDK